MHKLNQGRYEAARQSLAPPLDEFSSLHQLLQNHSQKTSEFIEQKFFKPIVPIERQNMELQKMRRLGTINRTFNKS